MFALYCMLTALPAAPLPPVKAEAQPMGPPPYILVVTVDQDGRAFLKATVVRAVPVVHEVTVNVNGKVEKRTVTSMMQITEARRITLDAKDVTLYDGTGKKITAKDLAKLLPQTGPVLVSADGKEVDPLYLRVVRKGAVVVVCKALARPAMGEAMPAPLRVAPPVVAPRVVPPQKEQ